MKIVRDIKALTDMVEDVDAPLTEVQKDRVQRLVCQQVAKDDGTAEEAAELMQMLGVHPSQNVLEEEYISIRRLRSIKL